MNGFADHDLDEVAFGDSKGNIVQAFDAFRMYPATSFLQILQRIPDRVTVFDVLIEVNCPFIVLV